MELKKQVCSLELAKKLKELGVPQKSFFKWGNLYNNRNLVWDLYVPPEFNKIPHPDLWIHGISAFTVAELGELLPARVIQVTKINNKEDIGHLYYMKWDDDDSDCDGTNPDTCIKRKWQGEIGRQIFKDISEAECRAKMLIYLLENKLITL